MEVCLFVFDILYLNGQPVVGFTLAQRRQLLRSCLRWIPGQVELAASTELSLGSLSAVKEQPEGARSQGLAVEATEVVAESDNSHGSGTDDDVHISKLSSQV